MRQTLSEKQQNEYNGNVIKALSVKYALSSLASAVAETGFNDINFINESLIIKL